MPNLTVATRFLWPKWGVLYHVSSNEGYVINNLNLYKPGCKKNMTDSLANIDWYDLMMVWKPDKF